MKEPDNLHIQFKESIKLKLRKSLWQFFLGHSYVNKKGQMRVVFDTAGEDNFYKRLHARYTGEYCRENKLLKEIGMEVESSNILQQEISALKHNLANMQRIALRWNVLKNKNKKKSYFDRVLIALVDKVTLYLYKKYNVK